MDYLEDLKLVYNKALKVTIDRVKTNPIALILPLIYGILMYAIYIILGEIGLGLMTGFLVPILYSMVLSSYFEQLSDLNSYNRLGLRGLKSSFTRNFSSIYSVYFILILVSYFIGGAGNASLVIMLGMYVLFNPISEVIYIRGESYTGAYSYSLEFMKENIVHWIIPQAIYLLLVLLIGGFSIVMSIVFRNVIEINLGEYINLGNLRNGFNILFFAKLIIIQILTGINVVFRGALFGILSGSTMRKRKYMGVI